VALDALKRLKTTAAGALIGATTALVSANSAFADTPHKWSGFYAGINVGYGWNDRSADFTGDDPTGPGGGNSILNFMATGNHVDGSYGRHPYALDPRGFVGGGQIGYNWQFSRSWIGGLELDLQGSEVEGDTFTTQTLMGVDVRLSAEQSVKWFGTARARMGYLFTPRTLVFGTAGLAYGRTEAQADFGSNGLISAVGSTVLSNCWSNACMAGSKAGTSVGWTAGAGIEWAMTNTITFKAEYLHVDLGSETVRMVAQSPATGDAFMDAKFKHAFDIARVGLNVQF
jgi:outer membrane immunogenic protein